MLALGNSGYDYLNIVVRLVLSLLFGGFLAAAAWVVIETLLLDSARRWYDSSFDRVIAGPNGSWFREFDPTRRVRILMWVGRGATEPVPKEAHPTADEEWAKTRVERGARILARTLAIVVALLIVSRFMQIPLS